MTPESPGDTAGVKAPVVDEGALEGERPMGLEKNMVNVQLLTVFLV